MSKCTGAAPLDPRTTEAGWFRPGTRREWEQPGLQAHIHILESHRLLFTSTEPSLRRRRCGGNRPRCRSTTCRVPVAAVKRPMTGARDVTSAFHSGTALIPPHGRTPRGDDRDAGLWKRSQDRFFIRDTHRTRQLDVVRSCSRPGEACRRFLSGRTSKHQRPYATDVRVSMASRRAPTAPAPTLDANTRTGRLLTRRQHGIV